MKHTPGPWHNHGGNITTSKDINACAEFVAQNIYKKENAWLIASSPDLLTALRTLVDHASEAYPHFECERGQQDIQRALDAIGKAEKGE